MSVIDEVRVGDAGFRMAWNQLVPGGGQLLTRCEVSLGAQRVTVADYKDLATRAHTTHVAIFLRTVAEGLVAREQYNDDIPTAACLLDWLDDTIADAGPSRPYTAFIAKPSDESFGVQTLLSGVTALVAELQLAPEEVGTIGDLSRRLHAAFKAGFDFDRAVVEDGPAAFVWHPGERRADGGAATWLRVRYEAQEVCGERVFDDQRGSDTEQQLAEALEKGVLMALEGGMFLMDVRTLSMVLSTWRTRAGELAAFEQVAAEHLAADFQGRWIRAEARNTLHRYGDGRPGRATLADVERALAARRQLTLEV